jgi:hypothetical protein
VVAAGTVAEADTAAASTNAQPLAKTCSHLMRAGKDRESYEVRSQQF